MKSRFSRVNKYCRLEVNLTGQALKTFLKQAETTKRNIMTSSIYITQLKQANNLEMGLVLINKKRNKQPIPLKPI